MAIFVTAGHHNADPGATANGFIERDLTKELRDIIVTELRQKGVKVTVDNDSWTLQQVIDKLDPNESDVCLEIHWNAGPETATGVETFIPDRHTIHEINAAKEISQAVSDILRVKKRSGVTGSGVKVESESARKKLAILRNEKGINLLVEICFITNRIDMQSYINRKFSIAEEIAAILIKYDELIK